MVFLLGPSDSPDVSPDDSPLIYPKKQVENQLPDSEKRPQLPPGELT